MVDDSPSLSKIRMDTYMVPLKTTFLVDTV